MRDPVTDIDRRRLLALVGTGALTGLAGCGGGTGDGTTENGDRTTPADGGTTRPTTSGESGVPSQYRTATAIGGVQRDPDALSTKDAVNYQDEPSDGEQCSNCQFYIEDRNGDGMGACAVVEGTIAPDAWCASYVASEGATTTAETTAQSLDQAVAVPDDSSCPVCNMAPANFPDWNAQAAHEDGTRVFFDTAGCATAYYALPGEFASTESPIVGLWVTDFETRETIDGTTAHYALETDSDRVEDPMRLNPAPFADRADAEAYVNAVEYLSTEDIVQLDEFDRDLATQYRSGFIESN
jgi:copper chaperone NosL